MTVLAFVRPGDLYGQPIDINVPEYGMKLLNLQLEDAADTAAAVVRRLRGETMSKLVEGIKDRMVAAAREAATRRGGCRAEGRDRSCRESCRGSCRCQRGRTSLASPPPPPIP